MAKFLVTLSMQQGQRGRSPPKSESGGARRSTGRDRVRRRAGRATEGGKISYHFAQP